MSSIIFVAAVPIILALLAHGIEKFPHGLPKQKGNALTKTPKDDLGYLYPIGEDETVKTLEEEMWEAISQVKRLQLDKFLSKKWQCKRAKRIYAALCHEWEKRWTNLTAYLAYYSEFGILKMGTKIEKALRREKDGTTEEKWAKEQQFKVGMAERIERTGMLDHLALKPRFRATADGSLLTFAEAMGQCFCAYNALFRPKNCQICKYFCLAGELSDAQIRPSSEFVNEKECAFVSEWVRSYKRAKALGDSDPREGAKILLSSLVPRLENDEPIAEETLKCKAHQFPAAEPNRRGDAFWKR